MVSNIDKNDVYRIVSMIVEQWVGESLSKTQRQTIDDFMAQEVAPLKYLELLDRMVTPAAILKWFASYLQTRPSDEIREFVLPMDDEAVCYGV